MTKIITIGIPIKMYMALTNADIKRITIASFDGDDYNMAWTSKPEGLRIATLSLRLKAPLVSYIKAQADAQGLSILDFTASVLAMWGAF